jgi:hypothetical protein
MHCKKASESNKSKPLISEEFSFLYPEQVTSEENEIAFEGNLPCGHCHMISIYLHFDLKRFVYKRQQKFYSNEKDYVTAIDSGALSFIHGNDVDPHVLIYGLEADTTQIQYFLIKSDTEIELLDGRLNSLHIIPAPILHKQAIRQISNK